MAPFLTLDSVSKTYSQASGVRTALADVSLTVEQGEFVSVMGRSGSGKTTLLQLLAGLEAPTEGRVNVAGLSLKDLSEPDLARYRRERVGYAFQFFNLMPGLSALENVALPLIIADLPRVAALRRAGETLRLLDMAYPEAELGRLSGGELQRVALARAVVHRPELLLADEPTASLDSLEGEKMLELLQHLRAERALTVVLVTHDARVAAHADRIVTLKAGRCTGATGAVLA